MTEVVSRFGVLDYAIFFGILIAFSLVGLYYACTGEKQRTASEFLLGNRKMTMVPLAFSLFASFMSSVTLLSIPAEIYKTGLQFVVIVIAFIILVPITNYLYLPIFYNLGITSVNEYLEKRFSNHIRKFGAIIFILQMTTYLSVATYAPSLAFSQVTGINIWMCLIALLLICSFYTAIGGLKAVVLTNVLQSLLSVAAMLTVLVKGIIHEGGVSKVIEKNSEGNRLQLFNISFSSYNEYTVWSQIIGGTFIWVAVFAVNQTQVQRYVAARSLNVARRALWWNCPGLILNTLISGVVGLVLYPYFHHCDPVSTNSIQDYDQLLPFYALKMFNELPGFPGLLVAGILSGSLSTLSAGLNSLAAVTLEDFVRDLAYFKNLTEEKAGFLAKIFASAYGILCLVLVFFVKNFESVVQAALSLFGMIGGPMLGLFTLGIYFPWVNSWGAGIGTCFGLVLCLWIGIGAIVNKPIAMPLPINETVCNYTFNLFINRTSVTALSNPDSLSGLSDLYALNYIWYSLIGFLTVVIFGLLISFLTGLNKIKDVDPTLISPILHKLHFQSRRQSENSKDKKGVRNYPKSTTLELQQVSK